MKTILVVDDEPTIANALKSVLDKAGYTALMAHDGTEALAVLADEKVDVVVADLVMPGMDGASLLRWLRASPETYDLPVILMSMLSEERVWALCSDYSRFLRKPLSMDALFAAIEDVTAARGVPLAAGQTLGTSSAMH